MGIICGQVRCNILCRLLPFFSPCRWSAGIGESAGAVSITIGTFFFGAESLSCGADVCR